MIPTKYLPYCLADSVFFETPDQLADEDDRFAVADRPLPEGWQRAVRGLWMIFGAPDARLPAQGWKIHVSATRSDADSVLDQVWDYCVGAGVPFKVLRSRFALLVVNSKTSARGGSGKLVTIYPADDRQFAEILTALAERLSGLTGPYILSDLRYGAGPLYVRYGAFREMYCPDDKGDPVPALLTPDGELVPDLRTAVFGVPDWVQVPEILLPHLAARQSGDMADFPFEIQQALQFSNSGGIYVAKVRDTGDRVVLREARPHAGLDRSGADAVERLARARTALTRLAGLPCVPALVGYHLAWEHHFLAEEFVEGQSLLTVVLNRHPLVQPDPTRDDLDEYRDWAMDVVAKVAQAIAEVHGRGMRFGDLHPGNVMLRPDGEVTLIDFELAGDAAEAGAPGLATAGFAAPAEVSGVDIDHYALECLRLFMFLPITALLEFNPGKAVTLHRATGELFGPVPRLGPLLTSAARRRPDDAAALFSPVPDWPAIRDSLVAGIHGSATPDRADRLFPGDPSQFATAGIALGSGAAGVLLALHRVGAPVPDEYVDWLVRAARHATPSIHNGLYDGLPGVAMVLELLGRTDEARECLDRALAEPLDPPTAGIFAGRAGIALNLLRFANRTGDDTLLDAALRIGDELAGLVRGEAPRTPLRVPPGAGLLRGMAGPALLFLRLYEHTGSPRYLDLAETALRGDLDHCVELPDGTLQVREGTTHLPYVDRGSGGIALVLREYLRHREDAELATAFAAARLACRTTFVFQPGLHLGRAGLLALLCEFGTPEDTAAANRHVRRLGWHALRHNGNLAFPGAGLQRLSMDMATGSAGVLLALHAAFGGDSAFAHLGPERPQGTNTALEGR